MATRAVVYLGQPVSGQTVSMRVPVLSLIVTCLTATIACADDSAAIAKLIADIDAAAKVNKERMLRIIVINTDVAATTLEQEKARTGLSYGELYVAHSLALACHRTFDQIVAMKKKGRTWIQIAQLHEVKLRGSFSTLKHMLEE